MKKYLTTDVFTPTTSAQLSFVERDAINDRLVNALTTPGKQIVVYGHSGSGKTTLLQNKLKQLYEGEIITRCVSGLSFEQLIADAFDQLAPVYVSESEVSAQRSVSGELKLKYSSIEGSLSMLRSSSAKTSQKIVLPPQLTAPTLARFLGAAKRCWVLEDFHKIDNSEKTKLAQMMKVFMDMAAEYPDVRIIAIGAVGTARQVVEYDPEMRNRVAEIEVPLMSKPEVNQIVTKGAHLLNVNIPADVRSSIVNYSSGLASICHQLCLNICQEADLVETCTNSIKIDDVLLRLAVERYLEDASDTLRATFDKALRRHRTVRFDNARLVISALVDGPDTGATHNELLRLIQRSEAGYPPGSLSNTLKKLQGTDRGGIVRCDTTSGRYSFSDPLFRVYAQLLLKKEPGDVSVLKITIGEMSEFLLAWMKSEKAADD